MENNKSGTFFSAKVMVVFFSFAVLGGGVFLHSAHADNGVLAITQISPVQTYASADGTYADGWKWTFNVTVPANETVLQMEFSDWTGSSSTIPAANDIQFYSAQSMNASNEAQAIPITASGTYSFPMYLNPSSDLSTSTAGNQIQITLEARIPVGSSGGSYSTSYGINTSFTAPISTGANPPAITGVQSTNVTSSGATITWTTNGYGDSEVYFGTQSGVYSSSTSNSNIVSSGGNYTHSVTLSGLNASATYYYEVVSADTTGDIGVSSEYSLVTQTLPVGSLTITANSGLGTQYVATGASNIEIGSYAMTASSVEGVKVNSVSIQTSGDSNGTSGSPFQNLKAMVNGTQFGLTQGTVASGTTYTFSGTPFTIPASGTVDVNVYADISSSTPANTTSSPATILTGLSGTGVISSGAISITNPVSGQNVVFNNGGTLTGSISAGTSQASYLGMNVPGINVAQYQFVADHVSNETLTQLKITDSSNAVTTIPATKTSDLINYRLTDTSGNVLSTANENASGTLTFNLAGLVIPTNSTAYVNLMADTNSYPYATSGDAHAYAMTNYSYTNASVATTTSVNNMGNLFTVYQTTLGVTGTSGWSTPNSISGVGNIIGEFTFTAGGGSMNPTVNTVTLEAAGSLIQASTTQTLGLYDASAPSVQLASTTLTGTGTATFHLDAHTANQWVIPYSSSKTLLVRTYAPPTNLTTFAGGNTGSYQLLLAAVTWTDGPSASEATTTPDTSNGIGLSPSISIPIPSENITGLSN